MKEYKIRIPDGWFVQMLLRLAGLCLLAVAVPFWWVKWSAWAEVEKARAAVEARRVMNECPRPDKINTIPEDGASSNGAVGEVTRK